MQGLRKGFAVLRRGVCLLAIWAGVLYYGTLACWSCLDHHQSARRVDQLKSQYQHELEAYSTTLAEGERLRGDHDYQIDLLKERYGYTKPDETPVIVLQKDR